MRRTRNRSAAVPPVSAARRTERNAGNEPEVNRKAADSRQVGQPASRAVTWDWFNRRRLFWIVLVAAALVYAQSRFWNQPEGGDRANWDYFAQVIARGGVPYRDVVNIKSPLSAYIGAAAIIAARPFGIDDTIAIRVTFILLASLTVAFTFLVAFEYFEDLGLALLAASIMLSFDALARLNSGGIQPKTPMVLFGLMSLIAVIKDRPFAAGVFGMLSALSWQPGLLFVGVAFLGFTHYLTQWRNMKAVRLMFGAAIPVGTLLVYFLAAGALMDFYHWNIVFNVTIYGPRESRSIGNFFFHFGKLLHGFYPNSRPYFYLSAAGLCIALVRVFKRRSEGHRVSLLEDAPHHAIITAPLIYFAFCMIDIQSGPDLIPLLPFVAVFAAIALVCVIKKGVDVFLRARSDAARLAITSRVRGVVVVLVLIEAISVAEVFGGDFPTLSDQRPAAEEIASQLQTGDQMFVYGRTEILVLLNATNMSKYFLLDRGKDEYLDKVEPGGFDGWFERLKAERPKIVVIDRLKETSYLARLLQWVYSDYVPKSNRVFTYFVRKDAGM